MMWDGNRSRERDVPHRLELLGSPQWRVPSSHQQSDRYLGIRLYHSIAHQFLIHDACEGYVPVESALYTGRKRCE